MAKCQFQGQVIENKFFFPNKTRIVCNTSFLWDFEWKKTYCINLEFQNVNIKAKLPTYDFFKVRLKTSVILFFV